MVDQDGSFVFFAGDFLVTPALRVVLLEFSGGMALRRLRDGPSTRALLPLLVRESLHLLLRAYGISPSPPGGQQLQRGSHWQKVASRPALPHP